MLRHVLSLCKMNSIDLPDSIDLSYLTEDERRKISEVLNRDDSLRKKQSEKNIKLKQEIDIIEANSLDIPTNLIATASNCVRCRQVFGYFFNTGEFCQQCAFKVCQKCKVVQIENGAQSKTKPSWLCILCHKYNQWMIATGNWIQLQDANNPLSTPVTIKDNKNRFLSRSPSPTNSCKSTATTSTNSKSSAITGSQLIKLSLFPESKSQILDELDKESVRRSTLAKRYSSVKRARSHFLLIQSQTQSQAQENDTTFNQNNSLSDSITPTPSIASSRSNSLTRSQVFFNPNKIIDTSIDNTSASIAPKIAVDTNSIYSTTVKTLSSMFTNTSNAVNSSAKISISTSPTAKSVKNLKFDENVTHLAATKSTPNISNEPLKIKKDDDLASITSSEFDSSSIIVMNGLRQPPSRSATPTDIKPKISLYNYRQSHSNTTFKEAGGGNNDRPFQTHTDLNLNTSMSNQHLYKKAEKAKPPPISLSLNKQFNSSVMSHNDNESDNEMKNMDNLFAKERTRQSVKILRKKSSRKLITTSSNQKLHTDPNDKNTPLESEETNITTSIRTRAISSPAYRNGFSNENNSSDHERDYLRQEKEKNETNNVLLDMNMSASTVSLKPINHQDRSTTFFSSLKKHAKQRASLSSLLHRAKSRESVHRSNGVDEVNDSDDDTQVVKGKMLIKLTYEKKSSNMAVTILKCENLLSVNSKKEHCQPYVKLYLIPGIKDRNNKRKTLVKKNGCNPEFNETFRYTLQFNELVQHKLSASVWHKETFDRNKFLGAINVPLNSSTVNDKPVWYTNNKLF